MKYVKNLKSMPFLKCPLIPRALAPLTFDGWDFPCRISPSAPEYDFPAFFKLFRMTCAHFDTFRVFWAAVDCLMTHGSSKIAVGGGHLFRTYLKTDAWQ